jgi:TPR repeat protein
MRRSTSNEASEGGKASTPSITSLGPDAGSVLEPVTAWKEAAAASERWWVMVGAGLGLLAFVAIGGATLRALSGPSPETLCSDGVSCNAAGVSYAENVEASEDDLNLAARLFQRSCDFGHAPACNNLGVAHESARGVPQNYERAMLAFERACSLGFAEGCSNQGTLYEHGRGVAANLGDAQRLYNLACRRGSALGCSNLGVLYANGRGVNADDAVAARLFAQACTAGSEVACANLLASEQRTREQREAAAAQAANDVPASGDR